MNILKKHSIEYFEIPLKIIELSQCTSQAMSPHCLRQVCLSEVDYFSPLDFCTSGEINLSPPWCFSEYNFSCFHQFFFLMQTNFGCSLPPYVLWSNTMSNGLRHTSGTHPPHRHTLQKLDMFLAIPLACLSRELLSMQGKLVNNKQTFSETKLLWDNNTNLQKLYFVA